MSKLQDLVNALDTEERVRVLQISLNPTESSLLNWLLEHKYSPDADPKDALNISDAHFRKCSSTLFKKIMDALPGKSGPFAWAKWLSQKKQHRTLEKELRKHINKLIKEGKEDEVCDLIMYTNEFFLGADLAVNYRPYLEEVKELVQKYKTGKEAWRLIVLDLHLIFYRINLYREKPIDSFEVFQADIQEVQAELDELKEQAKDYSAPMLSYWLPYVQSRIYSIKDEDEHVIEACKECIEIYNQTPDCFEKRYFINPQTNIALIHYNNSEFEEAYRLIKQAQERYPEDMKTAWYITDVFAQICIAIDKLDEAEETLLRFHSLKQGEVSDYFETQFGLGIVLSLIDLLKDRNQDCFDKLQVCKRGLLKTNFYSLDALLRLIENAYFMLEEDYDIALDQSKKNLKFHQYHKEHPLSKDFLYAHRLLPRLIKVHFEGGELKEEDLEGMQDWRSGDLAFAGKLLDKLIETYC